MNERIRQLEQQAMSIVLNGNDPDSDVDKMYIPSEFTKKFAELIVQECMTCSTWVGRVNKYAIEPVHTAHTINQRIRQHFGVEE